MFECPNLPSERSRQERHERSAKGMPGKETPRRRDWPDQRVSFLYSVNVILSHASRTRECQLFRAVAEKMRVPGRNCDPANQNCGTRISDLSCVPFSGPSTHCP